MSDNAKTGGQTSYNKALVFAAWTVTSFLCHRLGKTSILKFTSGSSAAVSAAGADGIRDEFDESNFYSGMASAFVLTAMQLASCRLCVSLSQTGNSQKWLTTVQACHALATLTTNVSMAVMYASSTFAIKMAEPITSAIVQRLVAGSNLSPMAVTSLPLIVGGAVAFAGNPLEAGVLSWGILAAFMSNLILAFRNVALKHMPDSHDVQIKVTVQKMVLGFGFMLAAVALTYPLGEMIPIPVASPTALLYAFGSSVFHVTYSYVSTKLVLSQVSVVTHSVMNIMKRMLVVLLLYAVGGRTAQPWNFIGLAVCTLGLLLFVWGKTKDNKRNTEILVSFGYIRKNFLSYLVRVCLVSAGVVSIIGFVTFRRHSMVGHVQAFHNTGNKLDDWGTNVFEAHGAHHFLYRNVLSSHSEFFPNATPQPPTPNLNLSFNENPSHVGKLSEKLTTSQEIIKESQRLHFTVFGKELQNVKYAMLFDYATYANKGDSIISVGELYFLARMNITVLYHCSVTCSEEKMLKAKELAKNYTQNELVIVMQGGGNIIAYPGIDLVRFKIIQMFRGYKMLMFPQSIRVGKDWTTPHIRATVENYCCNPNLTLTFRDKLSFSIAQRLYNGTTRLIMAPDMAFQLGHVPRFMPPVYDVMWIRRSDKETPGYKTPTTVPEQLTVHISDWLNWPSQPSKVPLEKSIANTVSAFHFLQRGRVAVTDRLHGHITAVLLDMPHVIIDNSAKKLSSYHNTWTRSLNNTLITDDPSKAMDLAVELLRRFGHVLPPKMPFIDLRENFGSSRRGIPVV